APVEVAQCRNLVFCRRASFPDLARAHHREQTEELDPELVHHHGGHRRRTIPTRRIGPSKRRRPPREAAGREWFDQSLAIYHLMVATGDEQTRFVGRVTGYTSDPSRGLHGEGQAFTPAQQYHYTHIARRRDVARLQAAWAPRRDVILAELDGYLAIVL